MEIQTPEANCKAVVAVAAVTKRKPRRGSKLRFLRAYMEAGKYLRDESEEVTLENVKSQLQVAQEVGYRYSSMVSGVIRREWPEVAALMAERADGPGPAPVKKQRLLRYIKDGLHLRDSARGLSTSNLKSQKEIAAAVGMDQKSVSDNIRGHFPAIAAIMATRKVNYRGQSI